MKHLNNLKTFSKLEKILKDSQKFTDSLLFNKAYNNLMVVSQDLNSDEVNDFTKLQY